MHIVHVIGARPNLMKVAPVQRALARRNVRQTLIHTGQHYDDAMFTALATELALPPIDINLEVGSGSHAAQTSRVMVSLEPQLIALRPDLVILYGDVNSTMAAAIVAAKLAIPMAHVEAGLRCGDRTMPEELNRLVTDRLSSFLFTPSEDADANLLHEGVVASSIHRVGNVMIDSLVRLLPSASAGDLLDRWGLGRKPDLTPFVFVTLHRPSNVDDPLALQTLLSQLTAIARTTPVVFAVHPRTRQRLGGLDQLTRDLVLTPPLTYLQCLDVQRHASVVVTDSGGIQEETTFLGIPCLTVRRNTERPITVTQGTNTIIGTDMERLGAEVRRAVAGHGKAGRVPALWDGRAAERIADCLCPVPA